MFDNLNVRSNEIIKRGGSDSSEAATITQQKNSNNESNIVNANLGTDGVNDQYAKAQGNRGKQLNPNQKHSLAVAINEHYPAYLYSYNNGMKVGNAVNFKEIFLENGFLDKIGARKIENKERDARSFKAYDYRERLLTLNYIEFLKDTPWEVESAYKYIREVFGGIGFNGYSETIWIDDVAHPNFNYDTIQYEDLPYCPAIDGY